MKKQLHKIELVKLAVPTIFLIFLAACSSAPSKPYARDFESNYVVKPISKTASMPDSAWIASHMKGFDPLPGVSEILFTKRLDESSDITQPAMVDGNLAGANYTLVNEHYRINATVRLKPFPPPAKEPGVTRLLVTLREGQQPTTETLSPNKHVLNDMYLLSISVHVDGYDIGQPDQYYKGFEITPKYRVNKGLEYLLTSLASNYDVFEDDLDGYKISPNDTWIDQRELNANLPHLPE